MNQRRGNWKPAAMQDNDPVGMRLVSFFKEAKLHLQMQGHEDAAFYFEQCEDWLREGKSLTKESTIKILGL